MDPTVVWTTAASNQLDEFRMRFDTPLPETQTRQRIEARLRSAFPGTPALIVLGVFVGYRVRTDEIIVLIDTGGGTAIAKLATASRLRREYHALRSATRRGFDGNQVFLRARLAPSDDAPVALLYETAQSRIDLPDTKPLESVFRSSVQYNSPTPESVAGVLAELVESVGAECYKKSGAQQPIATLWPLAGMEDIRLNPDDTGHCHRLGDSLPRWETGQPAEVRRNALAAFPIRRDRDRFLDPVDVFRAVLASLRHGVRDGSGPGSARLAALIPRVLVGAAHGDLHGKNVIVGVRNNAAVLPALFDYENMSPSNLVAWDFAKLETELKIRSADDVWPAMPLRRLAQEIAAFEQALADRTERHRHDQQWPSPTGETPRDRLFALVLHLRKLAARWLGSNRPEEWLWEYHFALAAYGVYSARYANQSTRERMAAFVSAGVSAGRYAWTVTGGGGWYGPPPGDELVRIWELNRSGDPAKYRTARESAEALVTASPHDLHGWYELAFAQLKSKDRAAALATLERANGAFAGHLDEDTFCLWGRCFKDAGDEARQAAASAAANAPERREKLLAADESYRRAAEYYQRGYELDGDRFPGINLGTLWLVRAALAKALGRPDWSEYRTRAEKIAAELLAATDRWTAKLEDDDIWMIATRAEAQLLLRNWDPAADEYTRARTQPRIKPDHLAVMKAQVARILTAYHELGVMPLCPFGSSDSLTTLFQLPPVLETSK